jgi:hypothetical protein
MEETYNNMGPSLESGIIIINLPSAYAAFTSVPQPYTRQRQMLIQDASRAGADFMCR